MSSPATGTHDRQNSALLLTPKNSEELHRHRLNPSPVSPPSPNSKLMSKPSAKARLLAVSSSSILHSDFRLLAGDVEAAESAEPSSGAGEWRRRRARRSESTSACTNTIAALTALTIGMMRLLAPDVSWSSASGGDDMAAERGEREGI